MKDELYDYTPPSKGGWEGEKWNDNFDSDWDDKEWSNEW